MNKILTFLIYLFALLLIGLTYRFSFRYKKGLTCLRAFLVLTRISGFRSVNVGIDTLQYVTAYPDIGNSPLGSFTTRYEIGFNLFCYFLYQISSNPQLLIFASSLLIQFLYIFFIYKYSDDVLFSLFAYVLTLCFCFNRSAMRQAIGFGIALYGIPLLRKKKTALFSLIPIVIGALFHKAALITGILVLAPFIGENKKFSLFCLICALLIDFFGDPLLRAVISRTSYFQYLDSEFFQAAVAGGRVNLRIPLSLYAIGFSSWNNKKVRVAEKIVSLSPNRPYVLSVSGTEESLNAFTSSLPYRVKTISYSDTPAFAFSLTIGCSFLILARHHLIFGRRCFLFLPIAAFLFPNAVKGTGNEKKKKVLALAVRFFVFSLVHFLRPAWYGTSSYQLFF